MAISIGELEAILKLKDEMSGQLQEATKNTGLFGSMFEGTMGAAMAVGAGVSAVIGAMEVALVSLANRGSDVNDVSSALDGFTGSAQASNDILAQMKAGTLGTVDSFTLMKESSRLLGAGVDLNAEQFGELSKAAFALQNRGLGPTKDMLALVSDAMVTGRTRAIAMKLGVVDVGDAEVAYANKLGKVKEDLTDLEKTEAKRIAVMSLLEKAVKQAGDAHRDFGEELERASAFVSDFIDEIGSGIAKSPELSSAVDKISKALDDAFSGERSGAIETIISALETLATTTADVVVEIIKIVKQLIDFSRWVVDNSDNLKLLGLALLGVLAYINASSISLGIYQIAAYAAAVATGAFDLALAPVSLTIMAIAATLAGVVIAYKYFSKSTGDASVAAADHAKELAKTTAESELAKAKTQELADAKNAEREAAEKATKAGLAQQEVLKAAKKVLDEQAEALNKLHGYTVGYEATLLTVDDTLRKQIETYLASGASIGDLVKAYPQLTQAQVESVQKGVEAEKKRVDALKKANEEIVKLQQDAAAAIEALDADTLANRIKHLDTKKAADIHAAMISITTIEQQLEAIFAINKKYDALGVAEQRKAADEKNKIIMAGAMLYLSIVKTNTDAAFNLTATDREKSLRAIQQNEIEKLEEIRQKTFESTGLRKLAEDAVREGSKASVAALSIDNAALTANSKKQLQETADIAKNTYEAMKAHPENFSKATIEAFKKTAEAADDTAKGIQHNWKDAFTNIGAGVTNILIDSFTKGGGIVGAAKGVATLAGAEIGKSISKMVGSLGSMAGPIGAAVGALAGPLIEGLTKMFDHTTKDLKRLASEFGVKVSDETAAAIKASMKANNLSEVAATVFNAAKLFPTIDTTNIDQALKITHDAFSMVATGQLTVAQGGKVVDDMFTKMASVGVSSTGLISKGIQEMIALNNEFGTNSKAVADFVAGQVTNAEKGFAGALAITNDAYVKRAELQASLKTATGDTSQIIKDLKEQDAIIQATGLHSQEAASAVAASLTGIVAANMASGMSFIDAVRAMAPNVDALQKQLEATGYSGGAAFNFIKEQVALASDAVAGPALQSIEGYTAGMVGLSNAGMLNQETFSGLAGQIAGTEAALVAQGFSGDAVMLAMQGDLQTIWELQQRYGYTTDENTQALIDQGVESGLIGEQGKKDQEKILDVLMLIAEALGATLPAGLKNLGEATKTTADGMKTDLQNAAKDGLTGPNGSIASEAQIAAKELAIQMEHAARKTSRVMEESSEFVSGCWGRSKNTVIEYFGEEQGVAQDVAREISKSMDESAQDSSIAFDESAADMELFMSNAAYEIDGSALDIEESLKLAAEHAAYEFDLAAAGIQDALDGIDTSLLIDVGFNVGELTIPSGSSGGGGGGGGGSNNVGGQTLEQFLRNNPGDAHRYPGSGNDTDPYDYRGGLVMADAVRYLAGGGYVMYPKGTDTVPAMLTPGESVLTNGATQTLGLNAISKLNNGGTLSNDEVINELRLLRKQQAASDRQLPLLVALSVRDAMQLQR